MIAIPLKASRWAAPTRWFNCMLDKVSFVRKARAMLVCGDHGFRKEGKRKFGQVRRVWILEHCSPPMDVCKGDGDGSFASSFPSLAAKDSQSFCLGKIDAMRVDVITRAAWVAMRKKKLFVILIRKYWTKKKKHKDEAPEDHGRPAHGFLSLYLDFPG